MRNQESRIRNQESKKSRLFWLLSFFGFWLQCMLPIMIMISPAHTSITTPLITPVFAAEEDPYNLKSTSEHAGIKDANTSTDLATQIGTLVKTLLTFIGVVFFILMFYAGVKWMLARGKQEQTDEAKKIIENSIIGLIVIIISYALTTFVFEYILK